MLPPAITPSRPVIGPRPITTAPSSGPIIQTKTSPQRSRALRRFLAIFGVSTAIYRVMIVLAISALIATKYFVAGFALGAVYIMMELFRLGRAGVREVLELIPNPPSYSAVRATLSILEEKGVLRHEEEGRRYLYVPAQPKEQAQLSILRRIVASFFADSTRDAVHALIDLKSEQLSEADLDALSARIKSIKEQRRK